MSTIAEHVTSGRHDGEAPPPITDAEPPPITDAEPPFDATSARRADVILRSSDNVDFWVLKAFLAYSSPFFMTMFDLPREEGGSPLVLPVDDAKGGLPIVVLPESGEVLYRLLHLCYPICATSASAAAQMHTLENLMGVLEAALKYGMENVERCVREELIAPRFLEAEPLRVFALAMQHRLEVEARVAAKMTLRVPPLETPRISELDHITGGDLRRLYDYYNLCVEAARKVVRNLKWIQSDNWVWFKCTQEGCRSQSRFDTVIISGSKKKKVTVWWADYMGRASLYLGSTPSEHTVLRNDLIKNALLSAASCSFCRERACSDMQKFTGVFAAEIKRVISEVCVNVVICELIVHSTGFITILHLPQVSLEIQFR
jgi:hypothetical protein